MSWRDVLGILNSVDNPYTQNSHITQKNTETGNSADIADIAEGESKLLEVLASTICDLPITPLEVRNELAPADVEEWLNGGVTSDTLAAFARSLVQRREMNNGNVPAHYTKRAICKQCGPVWLWFTGNVLGCPWCWNRIAGRPIPRPQSVRCGDCLHFEYIGHPYLGHCNKGEPEAIAGLWDIDLRYCDRYLPRTEPAAGVKANSNEVKLPNDFG